MTAIGTVIFRFAVGDTVALATDTAKAKGKIIDITHGRYFVQWWNGRTWIYSGADLEFVGRSS